MTFSLKVQKQWPLSNDWPVNMDERHDDGDVLQTTEPPNDLETVPRTFKTWKSRVSCSRALAEDQSVTVTALWLVPTNPSTYHSKTALSQQVDDQSPWLDDLSDVRVAVIIQVIVQ